MNPDPHEVFQELFGKTITTITEATLREEERRARTAIKTWLPLPLRWLVDHPRMLRWYMRLPHRTEVIAHYDPTNPQTPADYYVLPKRRRGMTGTRLPRAPKEPTHKPVLVEATLHGKIVKVYGSSFRGNMEISTEKVVLGDCDLTKELLVYGWVDWDEDE